MARLNLNFRITQAEKIEIERKFEGQNLSKVIRELLLGDQADPRKRDKTIVAIAR